VAIIVNWLTLGATVDLVQFIGFVVLWGSITLLSWLPAPSTVAEPSPASPVS